MDYRQRKELRDAGKPIREERKQNKGDSYYSFMETHNKRYPHRVDVSSPSASHEAAMRSNKVDDPWDGKYNEHAENVDRLYDELGKNRELLMSDADRMSPETMKIVDDILYEAGRGEQADVSGMYGRDVYNNKESIGQARKYTGYESQAYDDLRNRYESLPFDKDGNYFTSNPYDLVDYISLKRELQKRGYFDDNE